MTIWETLDALSHQLELCDIGPDTTVLALLPPDQPVLADLVRAALSRTQADVLDVRPLEAPRHHDSLLDGRLGELLSTVDVVIDATVDPTVTDAVDEVRVLRLAPIAVEAHRYPPHANLGRRVNALLRLMQNSDELALTDHLGSELHIELDHSAYSGDAGRPGPGTIARYPAGWLELIPPAHRVNGQLVLMPGDANLSRGAHLGSLVRLEIRDDRITTIDGDNPDGDTLRALLEQLDTDDAYGFAHLTIGANPGSADAVVQPFDAVLLDETISRFQAGVVRIAFGDNEHADRPCRGTVELALAQRSVMVDNTPVLIDGALIGDLAPDVYELPG